LNDLQGRYSPILNQIEYWNDSSLWDGKAVNIVYKKIENIKIALLEKVKGLKLIADPRFRGLRGEGRERLFNFLARIGCPCLGRLNQLNHICKKLSRRYGVQSDIFEAHVLRKLGQDIGLPDSLSTAYGYAFLDGTVPREKYFKKSLHEWFYSRPERPVGWNVRLRTTVRRLLSGFRRNVWVQRCEKEMDINNFVKFFDMWGTSGATDLKSELKRLGEQIGIKLSRSKWATGLLDMQSWFSRQWDSYVRGKFKPEYFLIEKHEQENLRPVILVDQLTYLVQSFLSLMIEPNLKNRGLVAFDDQTDAFLDMMRYQASAYLSVDKDWSKWDRSMDHESLVILIEELKFAISSITNGAFDFLFDFIIYSVTHAYYMGRRIVNGLASGMRWTTLLNSLLNMAITLIIYEDLDIKPIAVYTMGDDSHDVLRQVDFVEIGKIKELAEYYGFALNTVKSGVTNMGAEFLKVVMGDGFFSGDAIRMFKTVIWNNLNAPSRHPNFASKMDERCDMWCELLFRLQSSGMKYNIAALRSMAWEDLSNVIRHGLESGKYVLDKTDIKDFILNDEALGGLGMNEFFGASISRRLVFRRYYKSEFSRIENMYIPEGKKLSVFKLREQWKQSMDYVVKKISPKLPKMNESLLARTSVMLLKTRMVDHPGNIVRLKVTSASFVKDRPVELGILMRKDLQSKPSWVGKSGIKVSYDDLAGQRRYNLLSQLGTQYLLSNEGFGYRIVDLWRWESAFSKRVINEFLMGGKLPYTSMGRSVSVHFGKIGQTIASRLFTNLILTAAVGTTRKIDMKSLQIQNLAFSDQLLSGWTKIDLGRSVGYMKPIFGYVHQRFIPFTLRGGKVKTKIKNIEKGIPVATWPGVPIKQNTKIENAKTSATDLARSGFDVKKCQGTLLKIDQAAV